MFRAPPDDEHMCSKHVGAWNKIIVKQKFYASSWLITEIAVLFFTQWQQEYLYFSRGLCIKVRRFVIRTTVSGQQLGFSVPLRDQCKRYPRQKAEIRFWYATFESTLWVNREFRREDRVRPSDKKGIMGWYEQFRLPVWSLDSLGDRMKKCIVCGRLRCGVPRRPRPSAELQMSQTTVNKFTPRNLQIIDRLEFQSNE